MRGWYSPLEDCPRPGQRVRFKVSGAPGNEFAGVYRPHIGPVHFGDFIADDGVVHRRGVISWSPLPELPAALRSDEPDH